MRQLQPFSGPSHQEWQISDLIARAERYERVASCLSMNHERREMMIQAKKLRDEAVARVRCSDGSLPASG